MTERISIGGIPVGGKEPLISNAVRWGDLLFLSGRAPINTETLEVVSHDFEEQARKVHPPNTLPTTEFKSRRVIDLRRVAAAGPGGN